MFGVPIMIGLRETEAGKLDRSNRNAARASAYERDSHSWNLRAMDEKKRYNFALLDLDKHMFIERRSKSARRPVSSFLTPKQTSTLQKSDQAGTLSCSYVPIAPNFSARIKARGRQISRELATIRPGGRTPDGLWNRYLPFESSSPRYSSASRMASYPSPTTTRPTSAAREPSYSRTVSATSRKPNQNVWFARIDSPTRATDTPTSTADLAELERQKMQGILKQITEFNKIIAPPKEDSDEEDYYD